MKRIELYEGLDVTNVLGVIKYDPELELEIEEVIPTFNDTNKFVRFFKKYKYFTVKKIKKLLNIKDNKKEDFPSFVPKTDETRVQNMIRGLEMHQGKKAYISEKLEGQSNQYISIKSKGSIFTKIFNLNSMNFIVLSRNRKVNNQNDTRWKVAKELDLINKLKNLNKNIALQGELIGPKIQGNIYKLEKPEFRLFLVYDIDNKRYYNFKELCKIANDLNLKMVPIISEDHVVHTDIKAYVELSKGNSQLFKTKREGIVIRLMDENFSFKSISPEYLLEQKD